MKRWIRLVVSLLALLGVVVSVRGDQATHRMPDQTRQRQVWKGDMLGGYVVSGCLPSAPGTLTLAAFACEGYVKDATTGELLYVGQSAAAVGPLTSSNGTYWLAISRDLSTSHSGWTRQAGTQYLWRASSTIPAETTGMMVLARLVISGGSPAITAVYDRRRPASYARHGSFDVRDKLYGGVADCTDAGVGTDNTVPFRNAIAAAKEQGSYVTFDGWMCVTDQITITLDTFQEGFAIIGKSWKRASESFPMQGYDSRIWTTNTDVTEAVFRFEQTVFSSGGSFTPVVLRDFGVQAASGQRGLNDGIRAYGIPIHAYNVGANYFNIGWNIEETNGTKLLDVSARKNAATNMRLVNCYEPRVIGAYLPESSTFYHGAGTPYTGVGLTISGAQFGTIDTPHVSGAPIGMTIDGTADLVILQPYFESNDNGAGTLTSATIGATTNNINLRLLNPHNQDPSALYNVNRMVGGRLEAGAAVLRTANTVNVDIVSKIHPSLNPFTDAGVPDFATARMQLNPNMVPDGHFILQAALNKHHIIDGGGSGAGTLSFITSPLGLAPGRPYLDIDAAGGTKVYFYPTTMGNHSIKAGAMTYYHIWYYTANTPQATMRVEFTGVDSGGTPVAVAYSSTVQLSATSWANARFAVAVPNSGGLDTLTQVRLEFTMADPGDLYLGSLYAGIRPEPSDFSPRDGAMPFRVTAVTGTPAVLTGVTLTDFNIQCTGETADAVSVATAGSTIEISTAAVGSVGINCLATPKSTRGY